MFNPEDDKDLNKAFEKLYKDLASQEEDPESMLMQNRLERFKVQSTRKQRFRKNLT